MRHDHSERAHHYFRELAYDCWGTIRTLRRSRRGGLYLIDAGAFGFPDFDTARADSDGHRRVSYRRMCQSGRFTPTQLDTIRALAFERLTIAELAGRERCTRQAIVSRVLGNSRGQGGIARSAERLRELLLAR